MKVNDIVFQSYGGVHRYGKVEEVKENFKGDGWLWAKVEWIDDERFISSQKWKATLKIKIILFLNFIDVTIFTK